MVIVKNTNATLQMVDIMDKGENKMEFKIGIDIEDLKEIEKNYDGLVAWLSSHLSSFPACAFILQTIMDAVDNAKEQLMNED